MSKTLHTILKGHTTEKTAYLVDDYPYGGLRCKIRYWLEYKNSKAGGFRFVSQTRDPKRSYEHWNNPKPSTYSVLAVMGLDEKNHVQHEGLSVYADLREILEFGENYGADFDETQQSIFNLLRKVAERYEAIKAQRALQRAELAAASAPPVV